VLKQLHALNGTLGQSVRNSSADDDFESTTQIAIFWSNTHYKILSPLLNEYFPSSACSTPEGLKRHTDTQQKSKEYFWQSIQGLCFNFIEKKTQVGVSTNGHHTKNCMHI